MEAAGVARGNNCDFIVALGGGAVLDAAIGVATMATNPGDLWDYVNGGTGKRTTACESGTAYSDNSHHFRHRFGNKLLGRDLQSPDK